MSGDINVREGGEQKRHEERMAAMDRDATIREKELEIREKELSLNVRRDWRECWLFVLSIASLFVAGGSLYVAAWALRVASLPKLLP